VKPAAIFATAVAASLLFSEVSYGASHTFGASLQNGITAPQKEKTISGFGWSLGAFVSPASPNDYCHRASHNLFINGRLARGQNASASLAGEYDSVVIKIDRLAGVIFSDCGSPSVGVVNLIGEPRYIKEKIFVRDPNVSRGLPSKIFHGYLIGNRLADLRRLGEESSFWPNPGAKIALFRIARDISLVSGQDGVDRQDNDATHGGSQGRLFEGITLFVAGLAVAVFGICHIFFSPPAIRFRKFAFGVALIILGWAIGSLGGFYALLQIF